MSRHNEKDSLKNIASLAVARAKRRLEKARANEPDVIKKVLSQLQDCGLPEPDHIRIIFHQAGSDESVKADCERMARDLDASVLICDVEGKVLAFSWPNGDGNFSRLIQFNPECTYTLEDFDFLFNK
jgi:hypothetical protein